MEDCNVSETVDNIGNDVPNITNMPMVIFLQGTDGQESTVLTLPAAAPDSTASTSDGVVPSDVSLIQNFGEPGSLEGVSAGIPITWLGTQDQLLYVTYVPENATPGEQGQPMLLQVTTGEEGLDYGGEEEKSGGEESDEEEEEEEEPVPEVPVTPPPKQRLSRKMTTSWQTIADDVHIETKLQVLDAMLPRLPRATPAVRPRLDPQNPITYACDLCDAVFSRPNQYYGHLHLHTGERVWECETCRLHFKSQSQLRRHEKIHVNIRMFVCGLCGLQFDRESQLLYHERRIHLQERSHCCQFCMKGFFKRSDLRSHLNIHLGIRKNICETCGRQFHHRSNLNRHSRIHTGIKPYVCRECGVRFSQVNTLNSHKAQHHAVVGPGGTPTFECAHCGKVLRSLSLLKRHIRLMHGEEEEVNKSVEGRARQKIRQYYCQVCGESFQFAALLQRHELNSHEKESSFHCRNCGQSFLKVDDMKSHSCGANHVAKDSEDLVKCDPKNREPDVTSIPLDTLIDQSFLDWPSDSQGLMKIPGLRKEQSGEMVIYIRAEGQDEPTAVRIKYDTNYEEPIDTTQVQNEEINNQLPEITFPIIDNSVDNVGENDEDNSQFSLLSVESSCKSAIEEPPLILKSELDDAELNAKAAEDLVDSFLEKEPMKSTEVNNCNVECLNNVVQIDSVYGKIKVEGDVQVKKTFTCKECSKVFNKKSNYTQHLGLHFVDMKKYKCVHCDNSYAWKSSLNKHLQMAHGVNTDSKLPCTICEKQFLNATQLQEHTKRDHYKERPHVCTQCPKTFYKKADLAVHLRTHSKEKPYMCGTCGKSFSHLSHIIRHERIHSGVKPYTCDVCGKAFIQSTTLKLHRRRHFEPKTPKAKGTRGGKSKAGKATKGQAPLDFILPEPSTVDMSLLDMCKM